VRSTLLIFIILFSSVSAVNTAYAHSLFNSAEEFYGGYRVQVATYNDQQVNAIPPTTIKTGHWDIDYIWKNQGNHIVLIDLYDMDGTKGTLTYTFNMGTQSPFGVIFIAAITIGALIFAGIIGYIYLPGFFKKSKS